uniref:Uncharacterized protein n=1 Tax=Romanomermis culicivorax TaxID=13658 RepID=A0A915L3I7_ROMCU
FLNNALTPLILYSKIEQIAEFFVKNPSKILILLFCDFSSGKNGNFYDSFYEASFKSLEFDPLRDRAHFGVVLNSSLARKFNLHQIGQIRIFGRLEKNSNLN